VVAPAPAAAPDPASACEHVRRRVAAILGLDDAAAVTDDASLFDLGLDSLMAGELARALSAALGVELSLACVLEHPTVSALGAAIVDAMTAAAPRAPGGTVRPARAPRVAFLFSCQGGQYFGMGRELYETEPVFRARIDACDRILAPQLGAALTELMMYGADPDAIHQTCVTQPALVAIELALADLWASRGVTASAVIGHSFGEIAAAIHAGAMDLEGGLALVAHRARLMQSTAPGAMLAISAPRAQVTAWLAGTELDVAAVNGPASVVVSGERGAAEALAARLTAEGVTVRRLRVSHGSHSRMMAPVLDEFHAAIAGLRYGAPRLPIVANLTGRLADAGTYDARYWCRHLREPVQFFDGVQALRALDVDVWLEIGPSPTLISLVDAAGVLPHGGGVPSLRRGASERASLDAALEALRAHGRPARHEHAGCAGERGVA
jgi:acyl transferase domain-containing protein